MPAGVIVIMKCILFDFFLKYIRHEDAHGWIVGYTAFLLPHTILKPKEQRFRGTNEYSKKKAPRPDIWRRKQNWCDKNGNSTSTEFLSTFEAFYQRLEICWMSLGGGGRVDGR